MARVPWRFNNYDFDVNPEKDSGFNAEEVEPEAVAIGATKSTFQWGGRKSGRRVISGWLYGPNALTQYNLMRSWKNNRTVATLTDHLGNTATARLVKFDAEPVVSNTEWAQGRSTWHYSAEFVEM